jgi:hypothetical protein
VCAFVRGDERERDEEKSALSPTDLRLQTFCTKTYHHVRSEVLTVVKASMLVLWVVMPCGLVGANQRFGGIYYLDFPTNLSLEDGGSTFLPNVHYLPTSPHGVTTQKTNNIDADHHDPSSSSSSSFTLSLSLLFTHHRDGDGPSGAVGVWVRRNQVAHVERRRVGRRVHFPCKEQYMCIFK